VIGDHHVGLFGVQSNPVRLAGQHRTDEAEQVWIIDLERDALHCLTLEVWDVLQSR